MKTITALAFALTLIPSIALAQDEYGSEYQGELIQLPPERYGFFTNVFLGFGIISDLPEAVANSVDINTSFSTGFDVGLSRQYLRGGFLYGVLVTSATARVAGSSIEFVENSHTFGPFIGLQAEADPPRGSLVGVAAYLDYGLMGVQSNYTFANSSLNFSLDLALYHMVRAGIDFPIGQSFRLGGYIGGFIANDPDERGNAFVSGVTLGLKY